MSPARWRKIDELYHAARECGPDQRTAFLEGACRGDEELRREIESLLAQHSSGDNILDVPAVALVAEAIATGLAAGAQLGPYRIEGVLGAGGMGEVYRAVDTRLGRQVAIKISAERFSGRFEREARAIAALNHPHICTLHDVGPNYLVLELVEGETLAKRLRQGRLAVEQALRFGMETADALAEAHERGIVHRDLKPGNIMITAKGVKVLDFGLAKMPEAPGDPVTVTGAVMGTPAYMAPEQLAGAACDGRADIYALGLILHEMFTGKRFQAGQKPPVEDIPTGVWHVIGRCLEPDREKRWQSARDLKLELEWASQAAADEKPRQSSPVRAWAGPSLPSLVWLVLGGALVAGGFALFPRLPRKAAREAEKPPIQFDVSLTRKPPGSEVGADIALSPDGTSLVFEETGANGSPHLASRRLDRRDVIELPDTEGARGPFFSDDGQWVAFWAARKLKKIPLSGGSPIDLCDATFLLGGSWGEDGNIVATIDSSERLMRIPSTGGEPTAILDLTAKSVVGRYPQVLPGAKAVLFTSKGSQGPDRGNIEVFSFGDGKRKTLVQGGTYGRYLPSGHLIYVNQGTLFAAPFDLNRLEVRGGSVAVLQDLSYSSTFGFAHLDFSRGGTFVYRRATGRGQFTVQWLDSHGNTAPLLGKPARYEGPRLSPNTERLAFALPESGSTNIWISEGQPNRLTQLSSGDGVHTDPVWTPDGRYIVYNARGGMFWARTDGSGKPQPLTRSSHGQLPWSFTRDGKRLAFTEMGATTAFDIWTVPLQLDGDGLRAGEPEPFLQSPSFEVYPAFSPDGRWIAYSSNKTGGWEVYVRGFPDGRGEVRISEAGGRVPHWPQNGRDLFYGTDDQRIMAVAYTIQGGSFKADRPRIWFGKRIGNTGVLPNFDVASDGRRVIALLPVDGPEEPQAPNQATFILNFFDEVRRRLMAATK